jgi:hypothetical protein
MIYRPVDNDFAEWAFGSQLWFDFLVWEKDHIDLLHAWNDRHSDLYRCHEDEAISESMYKMKQLYEAQKGRSMDKKMHKVTEKMQTAEGAIKKGKLKMAEKVLKGAEKKNEKLVKIDRDVRDPMIEKCEKSMKKGKK